MGGLAVTRKARERIIIQTLESYVIVSCEHATRVHVEAGPEVRIWREELAHVCPDCDRWTGRERECEWCAHEE